MLQLLCLTAQCTCWAANLWSRGGACTQILYQPILLRFGLRSCEVLNPGAGAWVEMPPMISARVGPRVVVLDKELVVVGGIVNGEPSRECEAYNPSKKR